MMMRSCFGLMIIVLVFNMTIGACTKLESVRYSDYENCLINLSESEINVDKHRIVPLYNQSACDGLSMNVGKIEVPEMCRLGSGHVKVMAFVAPESFPTHKNRHEKLCRNRGIHERPTLRSHLQDKNVHPYSLDKFLDSLVKHNFSTIYFIGDSVSIQLTHFSVCDLIRSGHQFAVEPGMRPVESEEVKYSGSNLVYSAYSQVHHGLSPVPEKLIKFRSHLVQNICVYDHCLDVPSDVRRATTDAVNPATSQPQSLVIVNAGLHWNAKQDNFILIVKSFAATMLDIAKEVYNRNDGTLLAFRETTGQHFGASTSGYYEHQDVGYPNSSSLCCEKHTGFTVGAGVSNNAARVTGNDGHDDADIMDYRDKIIYNELNELDPEWHRYLVWIKLFNYSRVHGADLHVEHGQRGAVDCTHLMYDPDYTDSISAALMQSTQIALDSYFEQKATFSSSPFSAAATLVAAAPVVVP